MAHVAIVSLVHFGVYYKQDQVFLYRMVVYKFIILAACAGLTVGMTRPQLKKTMTIMKNQCMPKNGVTEAQVGKIEQGVFPEDRDVMCYIACIYKTIQVVKNNRLDGGLISKQIDILYPQDLKEITKKGVAKCMPVQENYNDTCEGIFHATKCLYEFDPTGFIFP